MTSKKKHPQWNRSSKRAKEAERKGKLNVGNYNRTLKQLIKLFSKEQLR